MPAPSPKAKRSPLNRQGFKDAFEGGTVKRANGDTMNDAQVDRALGRVNQQAIIDAEDAGHVTEEWDRESPINGLSAAQMMRSRSDIPPPPAKVYLVRSVATGKVIMFQPFKPGLGGRQSMVDQAEFDGFRENARVDVANARSGSKIKRAILDELGKE